MSAVQYVVVVEISPKGVSLAWGPFSGPEADDSPLGTAFLAFAFACRRCPCP
jgi:hypothetical protein